MQHTQTLQAVILALARVCNTYGPARTARRSLTSPSPTAQERRSFLRFWKRGGTARWHGRMGPAAGARPSARKRCALECRPSSRPPPLPLSRHWRRGSRIGRPSAFDSCVVVFLRSAQKRSQSSIFHGGWRAAWHNFPSTWRPRERRGGHRLVPPHLWRKLPWPCCVGKGSVVPSELSSVRLAFACVCDCSMGGWRMLGAGSANSIRARGDLDH